MEYIPNKEELKNIKKCECCGKELKWLDSSCVFEFCAINNNGNYTKIVLCVDCYKVYNKVQDQAIINSQVEFYKKCKLTDKTLLKECQN